ncbi:hypothetical protein PN462_14810 [Spirulina sp. CS-785/01]|uniref:CIS tube protein n=1 Tax=Spirulina sp. CS-785/01 TaxID=3021716 RepID=UPI00232FEBC6|nr:hypothetical protein [Spirulina sp. CS-785/01]MDB9314380.1 hypothetical protein [Spirulina sp. CS-785/01]
MAQSPIPTGKLEKAQLISDESDNIEFMFNPTELDFSHSNTMQEADGARTEKGLPKVSFSHPNPSKITLKNIYFDTYETGTSVLEHINKFIAALDFATKGTAKGKRPPIYTFVWGQNQYLRCFIESLDYTLTRFLLDGTPVQAVIGSLDLKEVDQMDGGDTSYSVNRQSGGR